MTTTVEQSSQTPEAQPESNPPTPPGLYQRVSSFLMAHVRQSGMVVALAAIVVLFQVLTGFSTNMIVSSTCRVRLAR